MSVLVEAISVIVRRSTLEAKYPGGVMGYQRDCPNGTFCADEMLTRVGFMDPTHATEFLQHLAEVGIIRLRGEHAYEVAVVIQDQGFQGYCDWLDGGAHPDSYGLTWLKGHPPASSLLRRVGPHRNHATWFTSRTLRRSQECFLSGKLTVSMPVWTCEGARFFIARDGLPPVNLAKAVSGQAVTAGRLGSQILARRHPNRFPE